MLERKKKYRLVATIIVLLLGTTFLSMQDVQGADYFVGGTGASDSNPGTASLPFETIRKASTVAVAGDVVNIRAGNYRETIVPTNSGTSGNPITYQPDGSVVVTISGLNTADGGWTVHSGNIYKKTITLPVDGYNALTTNNTTLLANQLFKDGEMMFEARWPDISTVADLLDRTKVRELPFNTAKPPQSTNSTSTTITDAGIPANVVGARMWINGWYLSRTKIVTAQSGSTITFSPSVGRDKERHYFYLTGKLSLLSAEKEWHYENSTLYFWQPGGGSPTGVEYKTRNYGFDLTNRSYITLKGLHFKGCDPMHQANTNGTNITIDNIRATYLNHAFLVEPTTEPGISASQATSYWNARHTGTKLIGANSVLRNSELSYAACNAIWLGESCIAENNLIHDVGYEGNYGCAFMFHHENTSNQVVTRNTVYRTGRSAVDFGRIHDDEKFNIDISYNDFSEYGRLNIDLGAIYTAWGKRTDGTRVHHNWIHDAGAIDGDGTNAAIYWDMGSGPSTNDHNVCWNTNGNAIFTNVCYERSGTPVSYYYNNVFAGKYPFYSQSYKSPCKVPVDVQRNNIYLDDIMVALGSVTPDVAYSILEGTDPQFVGIGIGGLAYRIASGSPGINAGTVVPGITDGYVGSAPDIGAYELGGEEWVPGYKAFGSTLTSMSEEKALLRDKAYPNPVSGEFIVEPDRSVNKSYTLKLFSANGDLLKTECVDDNTKSYRFDVGAIIYKL